MSAPNSGLLKRLAESLMVHAEGSLPERQRDWGKAMRAELAYIDGRGATIRWALGCAITCYTERFQAMNRSHMQISSWLFGIESLICFGPLTLLWSFAILHLGLLEPIVLPAIVLATLAPIGLVLALRCAALRRSPNRKVAFALTTGFLVLGALQIIATVSQAPIPGTFWFDFEWRVAVLISALPALCSWHLSMLDKPVAT